MNYVVSKLITVSFKIGSVFKLFRKSKKKLITENPSGKIVKKHSNLPPEITELDKGLFYSANFIYTQADCRTKLWEGNNTERTSMTNCSIRYRLLTIPLGISVIKDSFSESITSKVNKQ
jgi:hypothetical protein